MVLTTITEWPGGELKKLDQKIFPALTGLRGVAALWVLFFHMDDGRGDAVLAAGYSAVDMFFLLSGFVLSHVYLRKDDLTTVRGYSRFLMVRLARIYPLHLFTLIWLGVVVVGVPDFANIYHAAGQRFSAGAFIANLFLIQNWGFWFPGNWNGPAWSLSAEWFAYLAFPLLLVLLKQIRGRSLLLGLAAGGLTVTVLLLLLTGHSNTDAAGRAGMVRMGGEFSAGCLLYIAFAGGWRLPTFAGQGAALLLLAAGLFLPFGAFALIFAYALLVVLAAQGNNNCAGMLEWPPALYLGEISYSIYLTHWIVIQCFNWLSRRNLLSDNWTVQLFALATIISLSVALHHLIKLPARSWGRRLAGAYRPASA